ncbi:MAG: DUF3971 domain-containing protein [Rickettsiales bacterium]|nr:DUF3971 domain-containing protein [Rickettsiales bacterium]
MKKSFKSIRKFVNIRNLCFFIFKICVTILLTLSLLLISFIVIFSIKPRAIPKVSSYIIKYINTNPNINTNFDIDNSILYFDSGLGLKYKIKDFDLKTEKSQITLPEITINLDFVKLLFGRIYINEIILSDIKLKLNSEREDVKEELLTKKDEEITTRIQTIIQKFYKSSISIKKLKLDDLKINIISNNNKNEIKVLKSKLSLNFKNNNLQIEQNTIFNINNSKINSKLEIICGNKTKTKNCEINVANIDPNNLKTFFDKKTEIYDYFSNIKGYFGGEFNLTFDKKIKLQSGNGIIRSKLGSFYFKKLFDEKLAFGNLIINVDFKNYFQEINIDSLTTSLGKTDFFISMFIKEKTKYKNIDLNFDVQNIPVEDLKRLWPNFLDNKISRPWVLKHIISGNLPNARANMNFKYFKNDNPQSGLQSITAKVDLDNVLLNYSDYFPLIKNINGIAIFTKKDMKVNIRTANVLKSKIKNSTVGIKFNKNPTDIIIKANLDGPLADLFVHIDKNDVLDIENAVSSILEDYHTFTDLNLEIPLIDSITFKNVLLNTKSKIFNKKNSLLKEDSKMNVFFAKSRNSDIFTGKIDLTNNNLEYIPLNIIKPSNQKLSFDYSCELKDGIVYIQDIKSNNDFISLIASGFLNINEKINEINLENITYNDSSYNLYYKSNISNGVFNNDIIIDGRNINYSNIFEKLKNNKSSINSKESIAKNKTTVKLNLKYLSFENNKKLISPILSAEFENNDIKKIDFKAKINDEEFVKLNFNKKRKMLNAKSNNFGYLFQTIGLTDSIIGGAGEINFNQMTKNGKSIIYGNIDIDEQFKIITDENANKDLLTNIQEEKYFKGLTKSLVEDSSIRFDKMRGNISYSENVLKFDEIVANSSFISLQILASGFLNLSTQEIKIKGLLMPMSWINGLFGANKLPIISELVFGQKNAGLFASKFEVIKKDKDSKLNFKIDKFSTIMPGFIRNIFDLDTYKNTYHNIFSSPKESTK